MNEIIASILDAEQKAEEIVAKAASDCRRISLEGAERAAYDSLAAEGGAAAQALKSRSRTRVDPAADAVLRRLFG